MLTKKLSSAYIIKIGDSAVELLIANNIQHRLSMLGSMLNFWLDSTPFSYMNHFCRLKTAEVTNIFSMTHTQ